MNRNTIARGSAALALFTLCGLANAQVPGIAVPPHAQPARPTYPEGAAIPRNMTDAERAWVERNPITAPVLRAASSPVGPVHCVAEYEPMESIIIAWEGDASWNAIQKTMVEHITTTGNADVWIVVDNTTERTAVQSTFASSSANVARIKYVVRPTDSIWIRDYGPRYIYEGDVRAIVDHTYNRPRPNDNLLNAYYGGTTRRQKVYQLPLVHGGGNYHLDANNNGHATRLINNENPSLTESQILAYWQQYQNLDTTLYTPFPTSVDSTQHIDMWMQIIADNKIVISDWPAQPGTTQDVICDSVAAAFTSAGWTVYRTPARTVSGVHYTYTNVVMCNDLVLIPTYTNSTITSPTNYNNLALATWQAALPGKTIVQVNCQNLVTAAGVMHCIVMHIPAHKGGTNPTAYIQYPQGGETFAQGQSVSIEWISDDDVSPLLADIALSTDGGATFPTNIITGTIDDGQHTWVTPAIDTANAKIRVTIRDASGNTGSYVTPAFTIGDPSCPADYNGDGEFDVLDFLDFLDDFGQCEAQPGPCGGIADADVNGDTIVDVLDFLDFLDAFGTGC
ncbi:MAG: agmatine deiminase family protein [Phycisphaeraceae bacterium]|nr:agmatine deiminase family protein [Phycisphaeraceae bacterium]